MTGHLSNEVLRRLMLLPLVFIVIFTLAASPTTNVTGQLVDISCYSQNKKDSGNHHVGKGITCAQACAREGFEVGLLTPAGKLYHIRGGLTDNSNAKLVPHMSQSISIAGVVLQQNGQDLIEADSLQEVQ